MRINKLYIAFCVAGIALFSCGPTYNLKQAKKHLIKAEQKGAKIDRDTIYKDIITERSVTDTLVKFIEVNRIFTDTLKIETTKWKTLTKFDKVTRTVFQKVECKPDTIRVPIEVRTNISAGYSGWQLLGMILFGLVVGALVGRVAWK